MPEVAIVLERRPKRGQALSEGCEIVLDLLIGERLNRHCCLECKAFLLLKIRCFSATKDDVDRGILTSVGIDLLQTGGAFAPGNFIQPIKQRPDGSTLNEEPSRTLIDFILTVELFGKPIDKRSGLARPRCQRKHYRNRLVLI